MANQSQQPRMLSAGIVIVRRQDAVWRYLLLRAYGHWDFPKGLIESGETPLEAAKREVCEETGLTELYFYWGQGYCETQPYGHKIARYYLAATTQRQVIFSINPELGRPEHHEYRWLLYDHVRKLAPPRLYPILAWADSLLQSDTGGWKLR